ncbi:MAG: tetratricopeptide repeat protein [Kiloniellaceae bacterium]
MLSDRQGNPVADATAEAIAQFDRAVEAFNLYRGDPLALLDRALEISPRFAMAHILKAWLYGLATEPEAAQEASRILATAKALPAGAREAAHIAALDRLLAGDWSGAAVALDRHSMTCPRDLVALQCGHLVDFYRANARSLRDRIARALPQWSPETPGYSVLLGMLAFGLEESGDYARAEASGREALALQPLDCWAHHAVAHVMEMQGRAEDGIGWMIAREAQWSGDDNFFKVHNWWHRALFHLGLGQVEDCLALYDGPIRAGRSTVVLDMVDASALLWRLHLAGHDVGDRWQELAQTWDSHADGKLYPFNDWHAVMAYLGAGRERDAGRILDAWRAGNAAATETGRWALQYGLPLVEGFTAFWSGDYETAVDRLHRGRFIVNGFGGSHAQRDIVDWTLTEAALRGGLRDVAVALANERLALKPHSPVNRGFLARAGKIAAARQAA